MEKFIVLLREINVYGKNKILIPICVLNGVLKI
ncbi:MAG: hypothetical protein ACJA1B_003100 [Polaribacter sp.]|jgi:hypothetical protein